MFILLDELTMFARQLDDNRFEAFLSFIQSLTEAAKMVPGILIIGSLPESDAEAGGERGKAALRRLEKVFGRVHPLRNQQHSRWKDESQQCSEGVTPGRAGAEGEEMRND
jgi:hypothetical protein